ncbi:hypothetical protein T484DRAFT_1750859 [Baffinella frigidus]|nr:hypothetical protein T484DRAFT_1750859 [Cryptophyta sp. CCMP2293]
MPHDSLSASLVFNGEIKETHPRSESREIDEHEVVISVLPENNTFEEPLVGGDEAILGDLEGAEAAPSDVPHAQYTASDMAALLPSLLPQRVLGSSPDTWGKEGDECAICLGVMAAGEHVSDLPVCYHTFHLECAVEWLKTKVEAGQPGCCPVCNAEILKPVVPWKPASVAQLPVRRRNPPASHCKICLMFMLLFMCVVVVTILCMHRTISGKP